HKNRHCCVHHRYRSILYPCVFIAHEVINPTHIAADGAGREKIEKHADQIVTRHVFKRRLDSEGPRQGGPAYGANYLSCQVNEKRYCDVGKFRIRESLQKPFDMDAREKIS